MLNSFFCKKIIIAIIFLRLFNFYRAAINGYCEKYDKNGTSTFKIFQMNNIKNISTKNSYKLKIDDDVMADDKYKIKVQKLSNDKVVNPMIEIKLEIENFDSKNRKIYKFSFLHDSENTELNIVHEYKYLEAVKKKVVFVSKNLDRSHLFFHSHINAMKNNDINFLIPVQIFKNEIRNLTDDNYNEEVKDIKKKKSSAILFFYQYHQPQKNKSIKFIVVNSNGKISKIEPYGYLRSNLMVIIILSSIGLFLITFFAYCFGCCCFKTEN